MSIKYATPVQPHPEGGWYCEVGRGGKHPEPCQKRAMWVMGIYADRQTPPPGSVVCDEHRKWSDERVGHLRNSPWVSLP